MSKEADIPTTLVEIADVETSLYRLRLQGVSIRQLAKHFKIPERKVRQTIELMLEPMTAMRRGEMLQLELERCEELTRAHSAAAMKGDVAATGVLIRIMEHRAALGGLFAAANVRLDPVQLVEAGKQANTTERIAAVLAELAANKPRLIAGTDVEPTMPDESSD